MKKKLPGIPLKVGDPRPTLASRPQLLFATDLFAIASVSAESGCGIWRNPITSAPLLIIGDFGMRKLPHTAAEDLLEIVMRRYERASTLLTSNRPVEAGASCSATLPPPAPCAADCCIMVTW
jgi:hypothetical protein